MTPKDLLKITIVLFALAGVGFLVSSFFGFNSKNKLTKKEQEILQKEEEKARKEDQGLIGNNLNESTVENLNESIKMNTQDKKTYSLAPTLILQPNVDYKAILKTTAGDITVDLFEKKVPSTVNNFVFLAREKFFDGTVFHRIIKDFMIQGGDPSGNGTGGPGYRFNDEEFDDEYTAGTLAMANSGPNTNGSQFFIMHKDFPLPKNYVIFGRVIDADSLKVIDTLANTEVKANSFGEKSQPVSFANTTLKFVEILEN